MVEENKNHFSSCHKCDLRVRELISRKACEHDCSHNLVDVIYAVDRVVKIYQITQGGNYNVKHFLKL